MENVYSIKKKSNKIEEIPGHQRFAGRTCLETVFNKKTGSKRRERNVKVVDSVEKYRYSQREVADYLRLHYSTISRLLKKNPLS